MRLGGPLAKAKGPIEWVAAAKERGYRAAYCPLGPEATDAEVNAHAEAARKADLVIAEVGAWSNPVSPDDAERREAIEKCRAHLALAERIGARCCVNISGSRGKRWDGPHPDNLTSETFDLVVETVRAIIDAVKPKRTFYTLETMPWMFPDSVDSYERLIDAIDRDAFAVHFDPVNLVSSPRRYFANGELIRDFIAQLGPHIRSCHAKDIVLSDRLTTHLDEVRPGEGGLDYRTYLSELSRLDPDLPLMLEHLSGDAEYVLAAEHVRSVAVGVGVSLG
jgi:sugar phosphate isomerase/epimerase